MNLNCAILHADPEIAGRLEEYIDKVPFLSLHGKYGNPLEALKDYYETKVEVYFIGIYRIVFLPRRILQTPKFSPFFCELVYIVL